MRKTTAVILIGIVAFIIGSCASAPQETAETAAGPPEKEYARAKELRETVQKYALGEYAPDDYQNAEQMYSEGESNYEKDNARAKQAFDEAIESYQLVITDGFSAFFGTRQEETEAVKKAADGLKANVAMKEEYAAAEEVYQKAIGEKQAQNYESAIEILEQAKALFEELYTKTKEKKERAEESLAESKLNLERAEEKAGEAETLLEEK